MKNKYLEKLEFDKIKEKLETFALTYIGKNLSLELEPSNDKAVVSNLLAKTTEAYILVYRKGNPPLVDVPNITVHLKALLSSGTLSAKYLLDLATILKLARNLKEYFVSDIDTSFAANLSNYFNLLYSNVGIENKIFSSIIDENAIDDSASTSLASIRRNIRKTESDIRTKLNSFMSSKYIQEPVITIRSGRFVIPVKQEYKSEVNGFVHDISSSGSTVFIEPMAVFELNNTLNSLKFEENIEIEKVLQNLSSLFFDLTNELESNLNLIGKIDFIFAKAKYAISLNGIEPIINNKKQIELFKARHPLIDKDKVVPIDINLGNSFSTLVVTGPNTGGKTVTLKTVGLLCAMAMSGLYIPANEKSSIYIFDNIFADIGDEQSIAESLSTFSSHMVNVIDITKVATSESLVLLDELGSGTDPIEGSSLAISILEYLHNKGCLTISTTHYPEIKNYALVTEGFENASSEFDVENLKPTYKLLIGVPGQSNAFAISKKLGLNEDIINKAKSFISSDTINIEELLKNIYDNKAKIQEEKDKILVNSKEIEELKNSLKKDNLDLELQAKDIINTAKIEARSILLSAKEDANEIIKELENSNSNKELNIVRNTLNDKIKNIAIEETPVKHEPIDKFLVNMQVYIPSLGIVATVVSLPNKSNEVLVNVGNSKMYFNINKLAKCSNNVQNTKSSQKKAVSIFKSSNVSSEINVIGCNVEEAIVILDKYLDDCAIANLPSARIVHGKGTGALRNGIHSYLKNHPHVKSYRVGTFGEGEMGVTIVEIK